MTKWIIAVVVVVVVALGAWWYFNRGTPAENQSASAAANSAPTAPDTSDAALIQDSAAIDAQIQQLNAQQ